MPRPGRALTSSLMEGSEDVCSWREAVSKGEVCEPPEEASGAEDMVFVSSACPSLAPCLHAQCGGAQLVDEPVSSVQPPGLLPLLQSSFSPRSLCQTTQLFFRLSLRLLVPLPRCMPPSALTCVTLSQSTFFPASPCTYVFPLTSAP